MPNSPSEPALFLTLSSAVPCVSVDELVNRIPSPSKLPAVTRPVTLTLPTSGVPGDEACRETHTPDMQSVDPGAPCTPIVPCGPAAPTWPAAPIRPAAPVRPVVPCGPL